MVQDEQCRRTFTYPFKQGMQFEELGDYCDNMIMNGESMQDKIKIENDLKEALLDQIHQAAPQTDIGPQQAEHHHQECEDS